jgi:predicted enzyme related to lactoylglutathione lyase
MKIQGLIEIIQYVKDMHSQVAFYRDVFGLQVLYPQGLEDYSNEMWVTLNTGVCVLALHGGGKGRLGADTPKIVFGVEDIQEARDYLLLHNVTLGEVRTAAPGVFVCDGKDPEGNPFSIESHAA